MEGGGRPAPPPLAASFLRFLGSGGFNTLVTWLLYLLLLRWLPYAASFSIAFGCGIALAYALNRYVVFRQSGGAAGPLWVALIYLGQYAANLALVALWIERLGLPAGPAPLFAVAVTLPFTFGLNRLVFSDGRDAARGNVVAWLRGAWSRRVVAATVLLVALPLASVALNLAGWLRHGLDLPFYDDWRGYDSWDIDSLDLSYLWRPLNDTLTPVGLALDALAQRFLDGNSLAYQALSMLVVLGGLLLLQWKLLRSVLHDAPRTAVAFAFTLLMLQPGSYWGRENLAYQQAVPLLFLLGALWLGSRPARAWTVPAIAVLGALSGLTYISGAFGALAAGTALVAVALLPQSRPRRGQLLGPGLALAGAGLATALLQFALVVLPKRGGTSLAGKPLGLPTDGNFWLFYLGKLGRSLMLPADRPALALLLVLAACGVVAAVAVLAWRRTRDRPEWEEGSRFLAVLAAIGAIVFTYLLMVTAGRLNFRPADVQSPLAIFAHAFGRFHFFWAALLWPWVVAGLMLLARPSAAGAPRLRIAGGIAVAAAIAGMAVMGAFHHVPVHWHTATYRLPTVACLQQKLQRAERIDCEEFNLPDLAPAYAYARHIGASFVRYFPVQPVALGVDDPPPLFRWGRDAARVRPAGEAPATMVLDLPDDVTSCAMLDVRGRLGGESPERIHLYFRPWGQQAFSRESSMTWKVADGGRDFQFRLENPQGFEPAVGIEPVARTQPAVLDALEVRCRLPLRKFVVEPFFGVRDGAHPPRLHHLVRRPDVEGGFRAGDNPMVVFRTGHRYAMATCRSLEVVAIYRVERPETAQLYFRPRGRKDFTEEASLTRAVAPTGGMQRVVFVAESAGGFEDELRFDPVRQAQELTFYDIELRCLRRTLRPKLRRDLP